jgi:hypothetical protein
MQPPYCCATNLCLIADESMYVMILRLHRNSVLKLLQENDILVLFHQLSYDSVFSTSNFA